MKTRRDWLSMLFNKLLHLTKNDALLWRPGITWQVKNKNSYFADFDEWIIEVRRNDLMILIWRDGERTALGAVTDRGAELINAIASQMERVKEEEYQKIRFYKRFLFGANNV